MIEPTRWVEEMLGAIRDERECLRRSRRARCLTLTDGLLVDCDLYEFKVPNGVFGTSGGDLYRPGYDRPVSVRLESLPAPGIVRVWAETSLGQHVPEAELRYRSDGPWPALAARLQDLRDPLEERISSLFDPEAGSQAPLRNPLLESSTFTGLNREQVDAVKKAWGAPVCRVWGPPGTGKTRVAAALISAWIRDGQRIILAAPTNECVDLVLGRLLRSLDWEPQDVEGKIVRLGPLASGHHLGAWREVVEVAELHRRLKEQARAELPAAKEDFGRLRSSLSGVPAEITDRMLAKKLRDAARRVQRLDQLMMGRPLDLLPGAQVVATTVHRVALGQVPRADILLIDEGSMVSKLAGLLAAVHAPRLAIVGDPRQLGPIVQSKTTRARVWLGESIFGDPSNREPVAPNLLGPVAFLAEQYRMPGDVCRLVSSLSYGGRLRSAKHAGEGERSDRNGRPALFYLDTSVNGWLSSPKGDPDRLRNCEQAGTVVKRVVGLLNTSDARVAIISPYRAHVAALSAEARRAGLGSRVEISTVHRVQGKEYPIVVISFPERRGEILGHFLKLPGIESEGGRLLTVAASRASAALIVIGDLPWLSQASPADGMLRRFLRGLREHGNPLDEAPVILATRLGTPPRHSGGPNEQRVQGEDEAAA